MKIDKVNLDGTNVLLIDGVPQSVYPIQDGGYWRHMIPEEEIESALILGLGAGTIARLLIEKNPNIQITAVEKSKQVVNLAKKHFKLDELKIKIMIDDAFNFIHKTPERYDYICVDIWDGKWFPFSVLSDPFISLCKRLLNENGWIYINAPNLDHLAYENLKGGIRDDIGRNLIYRWKKYSLIGEGDNLLENQPWQ